MNNARGLGLFATFLTIAGMLAPADAQLPNPEELLPGITIAGQPDEAALKELAGDGFVAVIDLRTPEEDRGIDERTIVEGLGMRYVPLAIRAPEGVSYENAAALDAILRKMDGPVLLHCATGNRAGALLALRQRLTGAGAQEALTLGIKAGMTSPALRSHVEAQLIAPPVP